MREGCLSAEICHAGLAANALDTRRPHWRMAAMQTIFRIVSRSVSATLALALSLSMTGCVTSTLWSSGEMRRFYEPASPPRLELFHDPRQGGVLAAYDEAHETRK